MFFSVMVVFVLLLVLLSSLNEDEESHLLDAFKLPISHSRHFRARNPAGGSGWDFDVE